MTFRPNVGDILLNKYECVSLVGEGAFGCVYRARDIKLDRIVAIKFINSTGGVLERFSDELEAIKNLDHPNIVRLYDYDILKGGIPCMVMEFVDGREIGDILAENGPFDVLRICEIALQVLDALVETHKHGIIHCDLKPENIMLTSVGARADVVKLIDFGVASILTKTTGDAERNKLLVGTPQYMAPEQIRHEAIGPWTDIYALGLILIELFSGNFVFDHDDPREVLKMQLHAPIVIPHKLACTELGTIIAKAVEKDVSKRYQSTQELYDDLLEASQILHSATRQQSMRNRRDSLKTMAEASILDDLSDFNSFNPSSLTARQNLGNIRHKSHDSLMMLNGIEQPSVPQFGASANGFQAGRNNVPIMTSASISSSGTPAVGQKPLSRTNSIVDQIPELKIAPQQPSNVDLSSLSMTLGQLQSSAASDPQEPSQTVADSIAGIPSASRQPQQKQELVVPELHLDEAIQNASQTQMSKPSSISFGVEELRKAKRIESAKRELAKKEEKSKIRLIALAVAALILFGLIGAGSYAWFGGLVDSKLTGNGTISKSVQNLRALPELPPEPEPINNNKPTTLRFSTMRSVAQQMAYVSYISAAHGHAASVRKLKSFRVIGTPMDAGIYVNDSLVCGSSPCNVFVFGDLQKARLEIQSGSRSKSADLSSQNPKTPVILSL